MILDAIIGLFGSIFLLLVEGIPAMVALIVNLFAGLVELVARIFNPEFTMRRMKRQPVTRKRTGAPSASVAAVALLGLILGGVAVWLFLSPSILKKKVTFIATDGHSLPFAALVVHGNDGDQHGRTDAAGNVLLPRFGITGLTIKDPRYVEQTWNESEIQSELTVKRSLLGAGLDLMAKKLKKPEDKGGD